MSEISEPVPAGAAKSAAEWPWIQFGPDYIGYLMLVLSTSGPHQELHHCSLHCFKPYH